MSFNNPRLMGSGIISGQSIYSSVTTPLHTPGARAITDDGREFEYVRSDNSTAIGKGKLATYDPVVAAWDKITLTTAVAAGATQIIVPLGATTLVENELWGATLSVDNGGEMYRIMGHAASSGSADITFAIDRPVAVALTTSSVVTFNFNACAVKISASVTADALPVEVAAGIPLFDVGAGNTTPLYFWIQKTGIAAVFFSAGVGAIGSPIYHGAAAGAFQVAKQTTAEAGRTALGTIVALLPIVSEYHQVRLNIA